MHTKKNMKGDSLMSDLKKYLDRQLEDPAFLKEYEATREEFEVARALIAARLDAHLTQKELAQKSGIRQSNISRIENGNSSPTVSTLQALANGMGKKLKISFID